MLLKMKERQLQAYIVNICHQGNSAILQNYKKLPKAVDGVIVSLRGTGDLPVNVFEERHMLTTLLEFNEVLYYFFLADSTKEGKNKEFRLSIQSFKKKDGEHLNSYIDGFKGTPTCITTGLLIFSNNQEVNDRVAILVGLEQGFIKVIEITQHKDNNTKVLVDSHKVEQKPVVSVVASEPRHYNRNICFILLQDSKVFLYNYLSKQIVAIFQPPILSHDFAICMSLHFMGLNIATASKSGQIFFWEIGPPVQNAIEKSERVVPRRKDPQEDEIQQVQWDFSAKDRAINVFPMNALHAASIHGLKWMSFYGDLIAIVSRRGLFRLIAVNFPLRDEYLNIIQYQIEQGEAISSVQIFEQLQVLVVTKKKEYIALLTQQQSREGIRPASLGPEYKERMNKNCYGTKTTAQCLLEKIKFGDDLRIESVERARMMDKNALNGKNQNGKVFDFTYSLISEGAKYILVGNKKQYAIGPCDDFFGVDR